eukprot:CAMPEP_0114158882 /NCGR_PEP_ID=MMETSP0043_2-20121206/27470_1 /TAXON_ID=464988 /ORGANISM="Hemiselmis andersenii, Strain CCMP644" /LENGTH=56 /DNA_ID=CAMNT_0001254703 /DNA_START=55 /DNA_END=222 /DNA_ORIENTATION=-
MTASTILAFVWRSRIFQVGPLALPVMLVLLAAMLPNEATLMLMAAEAGVGGASIVC